MTIQNFVPEEDEKQSAASNSNMAQLTSILTQSSADIETLKTMIASLQTRVTKLEEAK